MELNIFSSSHTSTDPILRNDASLESLFQLHCNDNKIIIVQVSVFIRFRVFRRHIE
jgi:hypothetical protein